MLVRKTLHGGLEIIGGDQYIRGAYGIFTEGDSGIDGTFYAVGAVTLSSTLNVAGATELATTLEVTGATDLLSTLRVTGAVIFSSTLRVEGILTSLNSLLVSGVTEFGSTLSVVSKITGLADLEVGTTSLFKGAVTVQTGGITVDDGGLTVTLGGISVTGTVDLFGATHVNAASLTGDSTITGLQWGIDEVVYFEQLLATGAGNYGIIQSNSLGQLSVTELSGVGSRNIVVDADGLLKIASGYVTESVSSSNPASITINTTITSNFDILYLDLENATGGGGNTHTHDIDLDGVEASGQPKTVTVFASMDSRSTSSGGLILNLRSAADGDIVSISVGALLEFWGVVLSWTGVNWQVISKYETIVPVP